MLNPKLISACKELSCNTDEALGYLLLLYHHLDTSFISQKVKDSIRYSGLADKDQYPDGTVIFKIPIYTPTVNKASKTNGLLSLSITPLAGKSLLDEEDMTEWYRKLNDMFPTKKESGLMYSPKVSFFAFKTRIVNFIKNYQKYTDTKRPADYKEKIENAFKAYIYEQSNKRWAYTKKSSKFVYDENGSFLADYITRVQDGSASTGNKFEKLL